MKYQKYPYLLTPVPKRTIWGGNRLKRDYGKQADFEKIAESWELSVREGDVNFIANGDLSGTPLADVVFFDNASFMGTSAANDLRFPLLIKFIDAEDDLSVQVHPDNDYALLHENDLGKTEMWYVVDADEGARLVLGLKDGCSPSDLADAITNGSVENTLNYVSVKKGDVFFIPPGTVHAIGKGILIAEIQQNSDVTYRVFDYNRRQADGSLRPLHTGKALDVVKTTSMADIDALRFRNSAMDASLLCSCEFFTVRRVLVSSSVSLTVTPKSFVHLLVLDSTRAVLTWNGQKYEISKGDSWYLPAGLGQVELSGKAEVLVSTLT